MIAILVLTFSSANCVPCARIGGTVRDALVWYLFHCPSLDFLANGAGAPAGMLLRVAHPVAAH